MMNHENYYVYIMTNHSGTLYTGSTNDLGKRVYEHKKAYVKGFLTRYRINRLVYYEETPSAEAMVNREREIKSWLRSKKVALIESLNPSGGT